MDYIENYKQILQENEYGFLPDKPISVKGVSRGRYERVSIHDACKEVIDLSILMPNGEINFPITLTKPKVEGKVKTVVAICFEPEVPNRFLPHEVILDKGWAICSFCYEDVTTDDGNFDDKAAKILKGDNSTEKIIYHALGGIMGDTEYISDVYPTSDFEVGSKVLLFLEKSDNGDFYVDISPSFTFLEDSESKISVEKRLIPKEWRVSDDLIPYIRVSFWVDTDNVIELIEIGFTKWKEKYRNE